MNICVFAHTFPRFKTDTPAAFMDGFCEGLEKAGNKVIALIPYDQKIDRKAKDQSYKIRTFKYIFPDSFHLIGYGRTLVSDQNLKAIIYIISPFYYLFGFFALLKLVKMEKIELINAHWILPGGFIAALVSLVTKIPLVITVAGSDVYMATKNNIFKFMALFAASRAKYIVGGGSPLWTEDLVKLGVNPDKTKNTIIYGVDINKFYFSNKGAKNLRNKLNLSQKDIVVLAVGRLVYKKGMHVILSSIPKVLKNNKNVKFIIAGDGDQRFELEDQVKKLKIDSQVIMPGTILRDELLIYYNLCDIYVSASVRDKEGNLDDQSIALVEAMACKKPVIATDLKGNRLIVYDNKNGFLFPMGRFDILSDKINYLVNNKNVRKRFAEVGYELAKNKFSVMSVGEQYTKLYDSAI